MPRPFFELPAITLAASLLGKTLWHWDGTKLHNCRIVETEAYTLADKASHAYRGRKGCEPMFAPAGTIYMYRIRQWDALNISALGAGCAVLIKAAVRDDTHAFEPDRRLSGQGLLCRAMGLRTAEWNGKFPDEYPGKSVGKSFKSLFNPLFKPLGKQLVFTNSTEPVTRVRVTPRLGVTADKDFPYQIR